MTAHETTPSDAAIGQASDSREARMVVVAHDGDGKPTVWCDPEIVDLVTALNNAGIRTVASCSGHGEQPGNIALADGRELIIAPSFEAAREIEQGRGAGSSRLDVQATDGCKASLETFVPSQNTADRQSRPALNPLNSLKRDALPELPGVQEFAEKWLGPSFWKYSSDVTKERLRDGLLAYGEACRRMGNRDE